MIDQALYRVINSLLICVVSVTSIALNEHKLWGGHWYSTHLDTAQAAWHLLLRAICKGVVFWNAYIYDVDRLITTPNRHTSRSDAL